MPRPYVVCRTVHLQEDECVVRSHQLKVVSVLFAFERIGLHAALVHMPVPHDERALAEILHRALEEHDCTMRVQNVSEAVRLELVIPEAIRGGLVVLP